KFLSIDQFRYILDKKLQILARYPATIEDKISMMHRVLILFLFFIIAAAAETGYTQDQQLSRISVAERADGGGLVLRYHLSAQPDSYTLYRPRTDLIQMNLYGIRATENVELPL